jgi:hypothetical protein
VLVKLGAQKKRVKKDRKRKGSHIPVAMVWGGVNYLDQVSLVPVAI